jgi:hypothetical protein
LKRHPALSSYIGERENLTLDKLMHALRTRSLPIHGHKKDLVTFLIEDQRKQSTQGSAESSVAAPPPSDNIADEEDDIDDEE